MSVNVIAHDTRLEGRTPTSTSSTITFEVGENTPIQQFFDRVIQISDEHSGIDTLYIMAHGVEVTDLDRTAIQFCQDYISNFNVNLFTQFREKLQEIVLFVCHAAETDMTSHGDGHALCRQMAINAQCKVTAAREVQTYSHDEVCSLFSCEESAIDFGEWEGTVVVYDRNGNIIAEFNNPSAWHDSAGVIHDPRLEPNPHTYRDGEGARHATMERSVGSPRSVTRSDSHSHRDGEGARHATMGRRVHR
ncbi:MAG: hypothetical protein MUC29_06360 [Pyrinomonadaceae bacterium]|jgi:hypothetical protein|nr:hypothetical protein [Pyrinomonadaceae bacterium]